MNAIESPCRPDCDARNAGCHGEGCPYGWAEYERAMMALREERHQEMNRRDAARPVTAGWIAFMHRGVMEEKRKNRRKRR